MTLAALFMTLFAALFETGALAGTADNAAENGTENGVREIHWDDLLPEGWMPPVPDIEHFFDEQAVQMLSLADAPVVAELDRQRIRLPGYLVPIDVDGQRVRSFLMVPYFGACIHVPPPPPNQVVFVTLAEPIRLDDPYGAHWVTGRLSTRASATDLAEAAYTLAGEAVEVFDWSRYYEEMDPADGAAP